MPAYAYLPLALLVVAIGVAYAFYVQLTALKSQDNARRTEADNANAQSQKLSKDLDASREELNRRRAEAAELREKLNEMRSRQHKQRESDRKSKSNAEADLMDQLEQTRYRLNEEQSRVDVLSRETKGMQEELARLKEAGRRTDEALKAAQAAALRATATPAAEPSAPVTETPAPAAAPRPPPTPSDDELRRRVDLLEKQTRDARRKAAEAEEELKRTRSKASNATRMQLLTKNELDLFREKMVWSEKRVVELERLLFENKIALPEREVAPQPQAPQLAPGILAREAANTGGEGVVAVAADYIPETEPAPSGSSVETVSAEPAAPASEPAPVLPPPPTSDMDESDEMGDRVEAVPPIRRPRAVVETRAEESTKPE
jgi:hypothetical protein